MARFFNTAGRCFPKDHYMLDPMVRLETIRRLIEDKKYFSLPLRQISKTTAMRMLMERLNAEGKYIALHFSCEVSSVMGANRGIVERIRKGARKSPPGAKDSQLIYTLLNIWAIAQKKPILLLVDEIDSLTDLTLISVLRQFRDGFQDRPEGYPQSIVLMGLKDVRDYKIIIRDELKSMGSASPFNVKDESLTLRMFTEAEVAELYSQHTKETGQAFSPEALKDAYYYSGGTPTWIPWWTN